MEPYLPVPPTTTLSSASSSSTGFDARADIAVRGFFKEGVDAYLDIAVIDTGADWRGDTPTDVLIKREEGRKITKYAGRMAGHGEFIPLVCSVYGTLGSLALQVARRAAAAVVVRHDQRQGAVGLHAVMIQASILRSVSHSMRARAWSPKGVSGFGRRFGYPDDSGVLWSKVGGVDGPAGWSEV